MFKMSMDGDSSGCELVKQMQLGGNLQTTWTMFEHVKCFQGWTPLAYHVYDHVYYKVMMIAIYDIIQRHEHSICPLAKIEQGDVKERCC